MTNDNLKLWDSVEKTDPYYTKDNSRYHKTSGLLLHKSTAINAAYQLKTATDQWGPYGSKWGLRKTNFNYDLINITGMAIYTAEFYYPGGSFEITNSVSILVGPKKYADNDFAKKCETDTLTKALSKLGFNADIFMGEWEDEAYVAQRAAEVDLEKAEDRDAAAQEKYDEIKSFVSEQVQQLDKLPSVSTVNAFAVNIKKQAAKKLTAYGFNPNRYDNKIDGAAQERTNVIEGVKNNKENTQ